MKRLFSLFVVLFSICTIVNGITWERTYGTSNDEIGSNIIYSMNTISDTCIVNGYYKYYSGTSYYMCMWLATISKNNGLIINAHEIMQDATMLYPWIRTNSPINLMIDGRANPTITKTDISVSSWFFNMDLDISSYYNFTMPDSYIVSRNIITYNNKNYFLYEDYNPYLCIKIIRTNSGSFNYSEEIIEYPTTWFISCRSLYYDSLGYINTIINYGDYSLLIKTTHIINFTTEICLEDSIEILYSKQYNDNVLHCGTIANDDVTFTNSTPLDTSKYGGDGLLLVTDLFGNVVRIIRIEPEHIDERIRFFQIQKYLDSYILVGNLHKEDSTKYGIFVKINATDYTIENYVKFRTTDNYNIEIYSSIIDNDDIIVIGTKFGSITRQKDIYIRRLDLTTILDIKETKVINNIPSIPIVLTKYYNTMGQEIKCPISTGLYIKRELDVNGNYHTSKQVIFK